RSGPATATSLASCWLILALLLSLPLHAAGPRPGYKWVATWAQAMTSNYSLPGRAAYEPWKPFDHHPPANVPSAANLTLRQTVLVSIGGDRIRIRLSNRYGQEPLTVSGAHIALAARGTTQSSAVAAASDRTLSFHGKTSVTLAPGHEATSDPVTLRTPAQSRVVVSLYFAHETAFADVHRLEPTGTDVSAVVRGDAVAAPTFAGRKLLDVLGHDFRHHIYLLAGVDVLAPVSTRAIVAFGDSITDGAYATTLSSSWPEVLAAIANNQPGGAPVAVVNEGINGNELTVDQIGRPGFGMSGVKRFEHDVIDQPGVTDVIVLLGTNDINRGTGVAGYPVGASADDIIDGLRMLADVAHRHHLRIYAGTIPPFAGFPIAGWYTPEKEIVREKVNHWILQTSSFDGVIPFATGLRGKYRPSRLAAAQRNPPPGLASLCTADGGLHPNDRGYIIMGTLAYDTLFGRHLVAQAPCTGKTR
ncbi:MAG: GDSL-type esterase/lipase family protein, partial [Rhodanobacteraceae bacterium]